MAFDFVIAGGGIGGTVLATLLGRQGHSVRVLERGTGPPPFVRPEVLWPATVEFLRTLLGSRAAALPFSPLRGVRFFREGEKLLELDVSGLGLEPMSTDPNQTRELLLQQPEFELLRGVEVTGVLQQNGRVVGVRSREVASGREEEHLARWSVGDDGVDSVVRKGCGITIRTQTLPMDLYCLGCPWPASLPAERATFFLNTQKRSGGMLGMGIIPTIAGQGSLLAPVRPGAKGSQQAASDAWRAFLEHTPALIEALGTHTFPTDFACVRRRWGHAPRYGAPGALLLGDAAHPVSPAGGQGANMAVADARAIADLVRAGSSRLLEDYEARRRPANSRSLVFTRRFALGLRMPLPLVRWVIPRGMRFVNRRPYLIERFIRAASSAFLDHSTELPKNQADPVT